MLGKRGRLLAQKPGVAVGRHDQQFEGLVVTPVPRKQLDQETRALQIAPALNFAQSQREDGLANFGKHISGWL